MNHLANPRPMKICLAALFLQDHLGGIGMVTLHLAEALSRLHPDWEITILTHSGVAKRFETPHRSFRVQAIPKWSLWRRLLYWHLLFPWKSRAFDIVHAMGNIGFMLPGARQVIHIHDTYEQVSHDRFGWKKRVMMAIAIRVSGYWAKTIVAVSQNTAKDIKRFYPSLHSKTKVILSGRKYPLAQSFAAQAGKHFVFIGTLEPGKRLTDIICAMALIPESLRQPLLVIGAKGWTRGNTTGSQHDWESMQAWVRFMGYIDDSEIVSLLETATALVMPSSYEGFGLPIIEAMACGCPVIAAANSGMLEAGGDAALFFETGNTAQLAKAMLEMTSSPLRRQERAAKGIEHVRPMTWENVARKVSEEYQRVMGA
jgi:glycosyltransferase involved in cell wall biosynthesis